MKTEVGKRYLIERSTGRFVEGVKIETKGEDDRYPTFELEDGTRLGVFHESVIKQITDEAPVHGIPRVEHNAFEDEDDEHFWGKGSE